MRRESIDKLARVGFVAKGVIYLLIGVLAAMWAFGSGGNIGGGEGAIYHLAQLPAGSLMVGLLGIGLSAYAIFRFFQVGVDPANDSIAKRVGRAASGVVHGLLALVCFQALGLTSAGGGDKKTYLGELMASDGGRWLAMIAGLAIIGAGLYQLYKAWVNTPAQRLAVRRDSWAVRFGRFGLAARGVVFGIIGAFLIQAGLAADASQAKTTGGALREIAQQSYGVVLLAIVALGLAAYGIYMIASARYRRVFA